MPYHAASAHHIQNPYPTSVDQSKYLHFLGALNVTKSRPDIATAVSFAAVHAAHPTAGAYAELLLCLKYLFQTRHMGLILQSGEKNRKLTLTCYVDASYLTHNDSKSHTGFTLSLGTNGTFYSKSSKQTMIATSSTHAEMRAMYSAVIDIIFLIQLFKELQRPILLPAILMEDNQPCIDLTKEIAVSSKKCRHFLMLVHFLKEQVAEGLIRVQKVPTAHNTADILTKIVVGSEFRSKALQLLGADSF
jgi:hypothetical protein